MPHQLRRIIAINIKNPSDSNPSGRISELDPRGGVLAVGDNGVGKTTFLRLIPLFYGATPSQVLKGSGKASMIRHTLPDPSSAVAYEYERESDANLRTVVMYAKDGEDIPDFRIVSAGFDETFFYDENDHFVTRAEFASRLHARKVVLPGVVVPGVVWGYTHFADQWETIAPAKKVAVGKGRRSPGVRLIVFEKDQWRGWQCRVTRQTTLTRFCDSRQFRSSGSAQQR